MTEVKFNPVPIIAGELGIQQDRVDSVVKLLADANTVPFIARYRKEATGGLDEVQIRTIEERNSYLVEFDKRRQAIIASIEEQGKMTDELRKKIETCSTKSVLEDLYLPYKPKRRTRAIIAKEKGLEPLALRIMEQPLDGDPGVEAKAFINPEKEVADEVAALAGARDIVAEMVAENADVRTMIRDHYAREGMLVSSSTPDADEESKFKDYYNYSEPVAGIPSHRFLAVRRGERENVLRFSIDVDGERLVQQALGKVGHDDRSPFGEQMCEAVEDGFKRLICPGVESDVRVDLKMRSDREAVDVFANNLRNLLMAPPFGTKSIIGIDPGLRTGCKCVALDHTGKFLDNMTFNLVMGDRSVKEGSAAFAKFVEKYKPAAVAVGNGTGGRETEKFVRDVMTKAGNSDVMVVSVSESGASVYSASELAGKEFPQLDLTIRGSISIARRLQDPLAELVKIEPKAIGVGQYQHDVHQPLLSRKLEEVVESCVNQVGVELNTASAPLLAQVAGVGPAVAANIVEYRETNGAFKNRKQLLKVAKLGPRTFEQAAGFMRIHEGENPLDASAVHPERYKLVEQMASDMGVELSELMGNAKLADSVAISKYSSDDVGLLTLKDIIDELKKPGRDPRDIFEPPQFRDDVQEISDLIAGMELEGLVTNVTNFGAFVDVGVHQDGLVHISQLADQFVKDPNDVVKVGDKIKVRVMDVDVARKRISLSAKKGGGQGQGGAGQQRREGGRPQGKAQGKGPERQGQQRDQKQGFSYNPFADLLKK